MLDVIDEAAVSPTPLVSSGQTSRLQFERFDLLNRTASHFVGQGRLLDARAVLLDVIERDPENAQAYLYLATAYEAMGLIEDSMETFEKVKQMAPDNIGVVSASVFGIDRMPGATLEDGYKIRRRFNELAMRQTPPSYEHNNSKDPDRKLRIGYVSGDMRNHSAAKVFGPVLIKHDPKLFDVCAYATAPGEDWLTETLKAGIPHWRSVADWSNERLYTQIRADQIDILVDLSGHTSGNRLMVFARKPAPIQVTAWGYATGTGLDAMDVFFADAETVHPDEEQWFSEKIIRLPTIVPFWPTDPSLVGPVASLPASKNGYLTYGVINRIGKLKIGTIELWARILAQVPDSKLIVKALGMEDPQIRQMIQERFERFGTNLGQLQFRGGSDSVDHQKTYNEIDVGLDPWPDGGGVSSLESLWMGVPMVTFPYYQIASRLTTSFQKELGLPWLSASSPDEYVERAVALNTQRAELARVRGILRDMMCASALCDTQLYVSAVEDAYRTLWHEWCAKMTSVGPQPFIPRHSLVGAV